MGVGSQVDRKSSLAYCYNLRKWCSNNKWDTWAMNGWRAGLDDFIVLPILWLSSCVKSFVQSSFWQVVFACQLCPGHLLRSCRQCGANKYSLCPHEEYCPQVERDSNQMIPQTNGLQQPHVCSVTSALARVDWTGGGHLPWADQSDSLLGELGLMTEFTGHQSVMADHWNSW